VNGQLHAPVALSPRKELLLSIGYEAGWAPELLWTRPRPPVSKPLYAYRSEPFSQFICRHKTYIVKKASLYNLRISQSENTCKF